MSFSENLIALRKQRGYSQENLANQLGVSRQSVSKWESEQSVPDLDRLIEIAAVFDVGLDTLVYGENRIQVENVAISKDLIREAIREARDYEYISKWKIGSIPLIHVNVGRGKRVAKGVVAIGNIAVGFITLGFLSLGLFSFGMLSIGLLVSGVISIGYVSLGAIAFGCYSFGAVAFASDLAIGAYANGKAAIGASVKGTYTLLTNNTTTSKEIGIFISNLPHLHSWIKDFILWVF